MPDVFTKPKRSAVMARIRSRGNRDTELALAKILRAHHLSGWRRHVSIRLNRGPLAGLSRRRHHTDSTVQRPDPAARFVVRPDFVFPEQRVAVFVDGCFWHGCPIHSPPERWLRKSSMPACAGAGRRGSTSRTGKAFWREKLAANRARDRAVSRALRRAGWRVVRLWEHTVQQAAKSPKRAARLIARIQRALGRNATT